MKITICAIIIANAIILLSWTGVQSNSLVNLGNPVESTDLDAVIAAGCGGKLSTEGNFACTSGFPVVGCGDQGVAPNIKCANENSENGGCTGAINEDCIGPRVLDGTSCFTVDLPCCRRPSRCQTVAHLYIYVDAFGIETGREWGTTCSSADVLNTETGSKTKAWIVPSQFCNPLPTAG